MQALALLNLSSCIHETSNSLFDTSTLFPAAAIVSLGTQNSHNFARIVMKPSLLIVIEAIKISSLDCQYLM